MRPIVVAIVMVLVPDGADKVTFGHTWRVVLAENEREVNEIGWVPLSVDQGFDERIRSIESIRLSIDGRIVSGCVVLDLE